VSVVSLTYMLAAAFILMGFSRRGSGASPESWFYSSAAYTTFGQDCSTDFA
jgi:hypothetical protein